jgi:hypothetical protein
LLPGGWFGCGRSGGGNDGGLRAGRNVLPLGVVGGAGFRGVEEALDLQPLRERWLRLLAAGDAPGEVGGLVDEGVVVAEPVSGRPPCTGVRMAGLGDEDPAEAGRFCRVGVVREPELVEVFEVEGH